MTPLKPVRPATRIALGVAFFILFTLVWAGFTLGGFVSKTFLADPITMVRSGWTLLTEMGFGWDIAMTVWRVLGGFAIAAVLALPLGVAMGAYKPIEAFFEPFVSFARYLPASAFIPLLILWAGIGEAQKLSVIFIGSFFQLVLMIAVVVGNTRRDLVEAAYTLGCSDTAIVKRVMIRGAAPEICEILRMVLGWAWTYVIVAELIGASSGIGHMITDSQALLATDQIIFGIIVIGLIGLISDLGFKWLNRWLFPWAWARSMKVDHMTAFLSIRGVSRSFASTSGGAPTIALQSTDLGVAENDFITILGPSGCGKSTLLRIVAGLDVPSSGEVQLAGQRIVGPGVERGMVFQSYTLFPWLTVRDNVCFGLNERGMPRSQQLDVAQGFLKKVGLVGFEHHYPKQLSGGMQQRTAIARALANGPRMLLMDEPFGALDHQTRELMQELLLGIWEAERKTVLFVTHDIDEAVFMGSRVVVMSARPGSIKLDRAVGLPHPRSYAVKTTPAFMALKAELTEQVRTEVLAAQAALA